jgi:hypothetical protein
LREVTPSRGAVIRSAPSCNSTGVFRDGETPRMELANRGFNGLIPLLTSILSVCLNAFDCCDNAMVARVGTRVLVVIATQTV